MEPDVLKEVQAAEERIRPHVRETQLEPSPFLSSATGCNVYLKCENLQHTGSFKFRGAISKLLSLDEEERARGVVAASTGNHGKAVALAARRLGCPATIFAPEVAERGKLEAIAAFEVELRIHGDDCVVTERAARDHAEEHGLAYVSPYNDPCVIGGQGTVGVELARQLPDLDAVVVAVGGGGLIGGVGGYLKARERPVTMVGASPRNSAVMYASLEAGRILDLDSEPTLSDGTAGGIEPGAITFELCRGLIDDFVLLREEQIAAGVRTIVQHHHMLVEGAAGAAVAALLERPAPIARLAGKNVAVILCGANIDVGTLKELL